MKLNKTQKSIIAALCILLAVILITLGVLLVKKQKQKSPAEAQDTQPAQTAAQQTETQNADASGTETDAVTSTVTETQSADAPGAAAVGNNVPHSLPADFSLRLEDFYGQTMLCRFPMTLNDWFSNEWEETEFENQAQPVPGEPYEIYVHHMEPGGINRGACLTVSVPADYTAQGDLKTAAVTGVKITCNEQSAPDVYHMSSFLNLKEISVLTGLLGEPDEIRSEPYTYASDGCYYYYGDTAELIVAVHEGIISEIDYRLLTE
jgi:hypothetical protein